MQSGAPQSSWVVSVGSFTIRPRDPYQFAYIAKRSTLVAVSYLTHAIKAHIDKVCEAFKAEFLDCSDVFNTLPGQGLLKLVHNYLMVVANIFGLTPRHLVLSQPTVAFFKAPFFHRSCSLFIPPIFTLNHWLPFSNTQMTSSSATLVKIPKAFSP